MKLAGILILLFFAGKLSAQRLTATVLDMTTRTPVANATAISKVGVSFTSATGSFSVNYLLSNDTIRITHVGYKTYKLAIGSNLLPATIYLQPDNIVLNEVRISGGTRNHKKDSSDNRREFAKIFGYKAPGIKSIFVRRNPYVNTGRPNNTSELVSVDVLQLASLLRKNKTSTLQRAMLSDEQADFMSSMFSKEKIMTVTSLRGDSLTEFMQRYYPSDNQVRNMTTYDMMVYIKKSYAEFSKPGVKRPKDTLFQHKLNDRQIN